MTDTRKRIKAYKAALPALRERVIAVALLLAISTAMITSASFAWVTLSRAPEAIGVHTEIAANGNLEIALSGPDGITQPGESMIGDSSAADGQTISAANLTWGNLINLADPAYGLDQIVLRPAVLNAAKLGSEPFRSVEYGSDGRVTTDQNSKFDYCTWKLADENVEVDRFDVTGEYGVRAIATVTERYEFEGADTGVSALALEFYERLEAAETENNKVASIYQNDLLGDPTTMRTLSAIIGLYMQARLNHYPGDSNEYVYLMEPDCTTHIPGLSNLYGKFLAAMQQELRAIVALANVQQLIATQSTSYIPYTETSIRQATAAELAAAGVHIEGLAKFLSDLSTVETDAATLAEMAEEVATIGRTVQLNEIRYIVDALVTVDSCKVIAGDTVTTVGQVNGISNALGLASASDIDVEIQDGILARFEQRAGTYVYIENQSVSVTVYHPDLPSFMNPYTASLKVDIYTKYYNKECKFADDVVWTEETFDASGISNGKKITTAGDTYGLAIDLWVRTNAGGEDGSDISYLTLEGKLLYEQATGTDSGGNSVGLLYSYEMTDTTTGVVTVTYVYVDEGGGWFMDYAHHGTNDMLTEADLAGKILSEVYEDAPVGYEGQNRVWEEIQRETLQPALSEYNTTQGSGSCYIFYADSPQEQQSILNLLSHMYVVFTDGGDTYLSTAKFDTEENHYYAVGGKVTVPLVVMQSNYYYTDEMGERIGAVTELKRNEATRITALMYLDGQELTNKEALAASEIQGTLNLQFGNNISLTTMGDKVLQEEERIITASVSTASSDNVLDFFNDDLKADVAISIVGDQPAKVTAFFQREINSFQGTRQETMTFTQQGGTWVCTDFTFPAPGNYVLRSVQLDGIDYELKECPTVKVEGFVVGNVTVSRDSSQITAQTTTIMTADNSVKLDLSMSMAADDPDKLPKSVRLEFLRKADGATVGVDMNPTTTGWSGSATFNSSGEYSLTYAILDGQLYDLGASSKEFTMYLGLSAIVEAMPGTPQIVPIEDESVSLAIRAKIVDNDGNTLDGLEAFPLYYRGDATREQLDADMIWNSQTGYYEGMFLVEQPDTYRFDHLESGDNHIYAASQAVVFYARSNKPASYLGTSNDGATIFSLPGYDATRAYMLVRLKNTGGAQVVATFENAKGQSYTVDYDQIKATTVADSVTTWQIPIPEVEGSQGGTWTLKSLALGNVMDSNGLDHTIDDPLVITLADTEAGAPTVTVISEYEVTLGTIAQNSFSGNFMDTHTVSDLALSIYYLDSEGNRQRLPDSLKYLDNAYAISDVRLTYAHQGDSEAKGGYKLASTVSDMTILMPTTSDGIAFAQSDAASFRVAGTYKLSSISFKIGATTYTLTGGDLPSSNAGTITVSSVTPTVSITDFSPKGPFSVDTSNESVEDSMGTESKSAFMSTDYRAYWNRNSAHLPAASNTAYIPGIEENGAKVTVFYACTHAATSNPYGYTGWYNSWLGGSLAAQAAALNDVKYHDYTQPSVTITLAGMGSAVAAELSFGSGALIYESAGGTSTTTYTWTADGNVARYIGTWKQNWNADSKTPAGEISATELVLTCDANGDGMVEEYKVPVSITIINEY